MDTEKPSVDWTASDPFDTRFEVPVAGGALNVARAGPLAHEADVVVLAVHGVTASHMAWRTVARELLADRSRACFLAPDLRGRGRSATLPDPYGMATHVRDLIAVLDHAGAEQAVLVGHSMGAHVVARLASEHPERVAAIVLLDGGLPIPADPHRWDEEPGDGDPTGGRMETACASADDYVAEWRAHPAFAHAWDDDVDAFARYDMAADGDGFRCVVSEDAVAADTFDFLFDGVTRTAIKRVNVRIRLLRAPRGPLDDECAVIPQQYLDDFANDDPGVDVQHVPDTNHYTLILGNSPGPSSVAAAIGAAARDAGASWRSRRKLDD
jgi:pimeloyl-ACP methyl ester carboxylesterase